MKVEAAKPRQSSRRTPIARAGRISCPLDDGFAFPRHLAQALRALRDDLLKNSLDLHLARGLQRSSCGSPKARASRDR